MNEPDEQPASDELRLSRRDKFQQGGIRTVAVGRLRVMSGDHMIGEQAKPLQVAASGEELERADPNVARRHSREKSAGQESLARHCFSGYHGGERTRRRNAQRDHRFAYDIFPQHRSERGAAIAAA